MWYSGLGYEERGTVDVAVLECTFVAQERVQVGADEFLCVLVRVDEIEEPMGLRSGGDEGLDVGTVAVGEGDLAGLLGEREHVVVEVACVPLHFHECLGEEFVLGFLGAVAGEGEAEGCGFGLGVGHGFGEGGEEVFGLGRGDGDAVL